MTTTQVQNLIKMLKASGVTYFKDKDLEIRFDAYPSGQPVTAGDRSNVSSPAPPAVLASSAVGAPSKRSKRSTPGAPKEARIPHDIEKVTSLLKLSDEELVDQMFPEGKGDPYEIPQPNVSV